MSKTIIIFIIIIIESFIASVQAQESKDILLSFETTSEKILMREQAFLTSTTISDSVARKGRRSLKVSLKRSDNTVVGSKRAEIIVWKNNNSYSSIWYNFSIFIPNDFVFDKEPEILSQWHADPDIKNGGKWRSPPIALMSRDSTWFLSIIGAGTDDESNITLEQRKYINLGTLQRDKWTDWNFHIKFRSNSEGIIEIYKNNLKLTKIEGSNIYHQTKGIFWKLGIYKWAWMPMYDRGRSLTDIRTIFLDEISTSNHRVIHD